MKKLILTIGLFLLVFAGLATDASAKDMSRRFGIGVDSTISNYAGDGRGLSFIYVINKYFGMQVIFGMNTTSVDLNKKVGTGSNSKIEKYETTIIEWNVSFRALIPIVLTSEANLTGVVGFTASGTSSDGFKTYNESYLKYNDGYQFSIDLGVRPEWFVTEHISIHTQLGIGINIITDDGSVPSTALSYDKNDKDGNGTAVYSSDAKGVSVDFFKNVDLLGMAGMTFWF
ncbi:MAG: hypothetical protein J6A01_06070 [Proteobacteria bacterium]|nr:hypothetical protein [Pseudomonadota bacterium]